MKLALPKPCAAAMPAKAASKIGIAAYLTKPVDEADLLIALGVRFDDRSSSSWIPGYSFNIPPTRLVHVDINVQEIGRNYPVAIGAVADR